METVKVDIQKLQLLNDRIAQTIEALNQVRMSVHGIHHTPAPVSPWGYGAPYGAPPSVGFAVPFAPFAPTYGTPAYGAPAYAAQSYGAPAYAAQLLGGLQHTSSPMTASLGGWAVPPNGISHTAWDPTWQARTAQTFPFVQYPVPIS
jgi:hypothetical protein